MILPYLLLATASATATPAATATAPAAAPAPPSAAVSVPAGSVLAPAGSVPAPADSVPHPLRLALDSTSAFGVTHAKFFNQLLGARLDYRFSSRFAFRGVAGLR